MSSKFEHYEEVSDDNYKLGLFLFHSLKYLFKNTMTRNMFFFSDLNG